MATKKTTTRRKSTTTPAPIPAATTPIPANFDSLSISDVLISLPVPKNCSAVRTTRPELWRVGPALLIGWSTLRDDEGRLDAGRVVHLYHMPIGVMADVYYPDEQPKYQRQLWLVPTDALPEGPQPEEQISDGHARLLERVIMLSTAPAAPEQPRRKPYRRDRLGGIFYASARFLSLLNRPRLMRRPVRNVNHKFSQSNGTMISLPIVVHPDSLERRRCERDLAAAPTYDPDARRLAELYNPRAIAHYQKKAREYRPHVLGIEERRAGAA